MFPPASGHLVILLHMVLMINILNCLFTFVSVNYNITAGFSWDGLMNFVKVTQPYVIWGLPFNWAGPCDDLLTQFLSLLFPPDLSSTPPLIPNLSIPSASLLLNHLWPDPGEDLWPHRVVIRAENLSGRSRDQPTMGCSWATQAGSTQQRPDCRQWCCVALN